MLEVTIAKDGMVEHVKMLTLPRNIHEFMILSVAKAWRFEPARLDGRASASAHDRPRHPHLPCGEGRDEMIQVY